MSDPTLVINLWSSYCRNCKQGADPDEQQHATVIGWTDGVGCGVTWTHVTTDYAGASGIEATRARRPDLTFVSQWP